MRTLSGARHFVEKQHLREDPIPPPHLHALKCNNRTLRTTPYPDSCSNEQSALSTGRKSALLAIFRHSSLASAASPLATTSAFILPSSRRHRHAALPPSLSRHRSPAIATPHTRHRPPAIALSPSPRRHRHRRPPAVATPLSSHRHHHAALTMPPSRPDHATLDTPPSPRRHRHTAIASPLSRHRLPPRGLKPERGAGIISSSMAAREIRRAGMLLEVAARGFAERRLVDGCRYASTGCSAGRSSTKPRTATSVLMLLRS